MSASSPSAAAGMRARGEKTFVVEAISFRNEKLTAEVKARTARKAKDRAIHDFKCEDHSILSATVTETKGAKEHE